MSTSDSCGSFEQRKLKYKTRKLQMMTMLKEAMERKLAALNASIDTLQTQISNDNQIETN